MEDIYYCIFTFLGIIDVNRCSCVNKSFNNIIKNDMLWNHIYFNCYGSNNIKDNIYIINI